MVSANPSLQVNITEQRARPFVTSPHRNPRSQIQTLGNHDPNRFASDFFNSLLGQGSARFLIWIKVVAAKLGSNGKITRRVSLSRGDGNVMDYNVFFDSALNQLHDERRYRVFADLERLAGKFPHAIWHSPEGPRDVVIWCSNDYLGMAQHPKVVGAMVETATRMGTGAGGTRNIAGTNHPLIELERELAQLHGKEGALVFTSGYVSNETGISTIAKLLPNCLLLSDALNHNSMIEGVRKSGTEKQVWRHNDMAHLEQLLRAADPARPKLILCESLYSMDGDVAPLHRICDLAERYGALTYVDEVHAVGM